MRHGLAILVVAAAEGYLATTLPLPLSGVVAWVALATALAGIGSAAGWPGVLGKGTDGRLPDWSLVFFWPWLSMTRALARALPRFGGEPLVTEVHPGWLLGGWPSNPHEFASWPAVIDLTAELPRRGPEQDYLALPTWDGTAPSLADIERGVAFALGQRARGREVLVHCAAGHSRSATVLSAALVAAGLHPTWEDAVAHMRARRHRVRLGAAQKEALRDWAARRTASEA